MNMYLLTYRKKTKKCHETSTGFSCICRCHLFISRVDCTQKIELMYIFQFFRNKDLNSALYPEEVPEDNNTAFKQ